MALQGEMSESPAVGPLDLGVDDLDRLMAQSADLTLLFDASTGTPLRRWHDPTRSALGTVADPNQRVINSVHPDDSMRVLDMLARTAHDGDSRTVIARVHPDRVSEIGESVLVTVHDVQHVLEFGLLVQAWSVDLDSVPGLDRSNDTVVSSLAAAAPVGLQVRSGNGSVSFENERFTELCGSARTCIDEFIEAGMADPGELIEDIVAGERSLRLRLVPTFDEADNFILAVASLEDVTGLRVAEEGRVAAEGMFRAVFDGSPVATAIVDLDGRFTEINESFSVISGYAPNELVGTHFVDITHPDDVSVDRELLDEVIAGSRNSYQLEKRYRHAAGHEIWIDLTVAGVRAANGSLRHFVAHVEDITARKASLGLGESSEDLAHWATHDHLTGLPNRRHLDNFLVTSFGPGRRADDQFAVLFLDLDDFKPVNDTHGHQVGDEVLRAIARRLRNTCREDVLVARYGGDEFVVVTRRLRTVHDLSMLVERIISAVRAPIEGLIEGSIRVGASVGVATAIGDEPPETVVRRADAACQKAKHNGKNRAQFETR